MSNANGSDGTPRRRDVLQPEPGQQEELQPEAQRADAGDAATPAPNAPKTGGFGQFAEVYRERWAASHPKAPQRWSTDAARHGGIPFEGARDQEPTPATEPAADGPAADRPATDGK